FPQDRPVGHVPELDRVVAAAGSQHLAVGAEGGAEDAVAVALGELLLLVRLELADRLAGNVPQLERAVEAAGNDLLAAGRPGNAIHRVGHRRGVGVDLEELLPLGYVPQADGAVVAAGG